jgi:hypothetical protein
MAATPAGKPNGELSPGAAAAQLVLRVPVDDVFTLSVNVQSVTALMSMYWLSQKSPPEGSPHLVVQPPVSVLTQVSSQLMFACTVQDPVQQSWHSVVQSVEPWWSLQLSVHWVSQLDEQSAAQLAPVQLDMHPAWQSVEQWPSQVNVLGMVVHAVLQLVWQVFVQVVAAEAVHIVEQVVV